MIPPSAMDKSCRSSVRRSISQHSPISFPSDNAKQYLRDTKTKYRFIKYNDEADNEDAERAIVTPCRKSTWKALRSSWLEGLVISLSSLNVLIAVCETDALANTGTVPMWLRTCNNILSLVFLVELVVRLSIYRTSFFLYRWNVFDFVVISVDMLGVCLDVFLYSVPSLSTLRILRLVRLGRSFKVIVKFPHLALICQGLLGALQAILWGAMLVVATLLLWSIVAVQLIHPIIQEVAQKGRFDDCERCPRAFATVGSSMLTLAQNIIAGDGWGRVSVPTVEEYPLTAIFFAAVFFSLQTALLNVMLAVIVDNALRTSREDEAQILRIKAKAHKKARDTLHRLCREIDSDHSGSISKQELVMGVQDNADLAQTFRAMDVHPCDMDVVFSILDVEGSGEVDYSQFVEQLHKMKSHDSHTMLVFIKYYTEEIRRQLSSEISIVQDALRILHRQEEFFAAGSDTLTAHTQLEGMLPQMKEASSPCRESCSKSAGPTDRACNSLFEQLHVLELNMMCRFEDMERKSEQHVSRILEQLSLWRHSELYSDVRSGQVYTGSSCCCIVEERGGHHRARCEDNCADQSAGCCTSLLNKVVACEHPDIWIARAHGQRTQKVTRSNRHTCASDCKELLPSNLYL